MIATSLTLDTQEGDDRTFSLQRYTADGSVRLDAATTLALPRTLTIRHSVQGVGPDAIDRHLIQAAEVVADTGKLRSIVVNLTIQVPRSSVVTNQMVHDLLANVGDFVLDGNLPASPDFTNVDAILRGES
jgi:hypothetical protein